MFECLACGGFDSHARGDGRQDDTTHSAAAQLQVEVGSKKRAPLAFGDQDVTGLLVEPIIEFGVVRREWPGRARTGDAEAQAIWCGNTDSSRVANWPSRPTSARKSAEIEAMAKA